MDIGSLRPHRPRAEAARLARLLTLVLAVAGTALGLLGAAPALAAPACATPGAASARAQAPRDIVPSCGGATGYVLVRGAINGVATIDRGTLTYTSNPGFTGTDTFVYAATGPSGTSAPVTQVVHVSNGANNAPVCAPTTTRMRAGQVRTIDVTCRDPDRDFLKYARTGPRPQAVLSALVRASDSSVSAAYTPKPTFSGDDAFEVTVTDGHGGSVTEHESIHVSSLLENGAPTCSGPATFTAASGMPASYVGTCTDPDGDTATTRLVARPAHGTVSAGTNGGLVYTPAAGYTGPDSFTWDATDGHGGTSQPTAVAVTVGPEHAPICAASGVSTPRGQAVAVHFTCSDPDHSPLTFSRTSTPSDGPISGSGADWTYQPQGSYSGRQRITFTASDGAQTTAGAVTLYVTGQGTVNLAPACSSGFVPVPENATATVSLACADPNGDPITVRILSGPSHGTLTGSGANRTYTPAPGYTGKDSISVQATDGTLTSDVEPINLEIYGAPSHDEGDASDTGGNANEAGTVSRGRLSAALGGDVKGLGSALGRLGLAGFASRGVAMPFHWRTGGRLTLTATAAAPKAKRGKAHAARKARRIVVAKASASRRSAGTKVVRLKLTRAGRALLRKAKSVKLTVVATFAPQGAKAVTSKRTFTLRRKAKPKKRKR